MKRRILPIVLSLGAIVFFGVMWGLMDGKNIAVLNPKGQIADQQLSLLLFTTALGLLVIIPVFVMLFWFIWKYRASDTTSSTYTPEDDGNRIIEVIWWGIPIIIIIVLSVVTWISTHGLDPYRGLESEKKPLHVQVVALQWRWLFLYPEQGIASINELRIPAERPIEFSVSADAPMSAFWIPNLGSQIYAMNGMSTTLNLEANKPGEFRGSNSNISGEGYADMNFRVIASSDDEFDRWVENLSQSNRHLDWSLYTASVAKPTRSRNVEYFMLHDSGLYDKIIEKYMGHMGHTKTDNGDTMDDMKAMDHSTGSHDGMGH